MSIIKRKAGSEDIVKSVLEFDEVPTEGSHNLVESGAVSQAIGNLGQPLQWKGPATVAELNAGITGIQPGWTYTLTDAGTLTDGSVTVEKDDEVAWTEDDEWFKVGGDSGKIELFDVRYNQQTSDYVWPTYADIDAVVTAGKLAALKVTNPAGYVEYYWLTNRPIGTGTSYTFYGGEENSKYVRIYFSGIAPKVGVNIKNTDQRAIAPMYSTTSTYAVNDAVMHDGLRYVCNTAITQAEDWNSGHWTLSSIESTIGSINNGGALTDAASVDVPNNTLSTLSTAQSTLTLNVNAGANEVPNFAVEVNPSVDCTLTVTKTVGSTTTTLNPSVAGGNSLTTGKLYQVTCVGSCWTLAEFTVPTP